MPIAPLHPTIIPSLSVKGIKYIKINRFDKQGNDNTLSLQELTNIRLRFDDLGIVNFPVLTISEYPDYYLYRIANVTFGNSTEKFKSPTNPISSTNTYTLTAGINNASPIFYGYTDTTGSINGNGLYDFVNGGYTVTVTCYFSASASPLTFTESFYLIFTGSNGEVNKQLFYPYLGSPGTGAYSASISYVPTLGSTLGVAFASSSVNIDFNVPSIDFRITQDITSSINNNILDHHIITSKTGSTTVLEFQSVIVTDYNVVTTDSLRYFNPTTGLITFGDTPNIKMYVTASVTVTYDHQDFSLFGSSEGRIVMVSSSNPSGETLTLSTSFTPIENSTYWLSVRNNRSGLSSYSNINLLLTQSVDPVSSSVLTILEPYLTSNFFYNDCNALYGNDVGLEYDADFMKVDYDGNGGNVIPSNQQEILNGTAERAPVKPYNYSAHAQTLPRYEGVKSTSLYVNKWTGPNPGLFVDGNLYPGDYNTYGKLPTVESSNIFVAYCDVIEENTPEINGASYAHIKYLIDQNGQIRIPNISENSLPDVQDTFITNENVSIYSSTQNLGEVTNLKSIIRGGQRVETILYNQNGYDSSITWENTINLADNNTISGLTNDYQALLGLTHNYNNPGSGYYEIPFDFIYSSGSGANNIDTTTGPGYRLKVTAGMIADNIGIIFKMRAKVESIPGPGRAEFELYNFTTGASYFLGAGNIPTGAIMPYYLTYSLPPSSLNVGDEWGIRMKTSHTYETLQQSSTDPIWGSVSKFQILQTPAPQTIITPALSIWQSASGLVGLGDNILFTTQSQLVNLYNSSTLFQQQIIGSGFNTSSLGWSLLPGDEFRFEGREDMVYMVEHAFIDSGSLPSPSLIINFNRPLASSSIGGTFNVNHFVIRRYINDPSSILFLGTRPYGSTPPYIIKPQYTTDLLNKNMDKYVIDLTAKGIITP